MFFFLVRRREALKIWKKKLGLRATYKNLLELFVKACHDKCANALCDVLKKSVA